jgi:hypothetical protein
MVAQEHRQFTIAVTQLAEQFGLEVTGPRIALYFRALEDLHLADVLRGLGVVSRRCRFFPSVAEIREAALGSLEDRALMAWQAMLRVARGERSEDTLDATGRQTVAWLGGWRHIEQYPTEPRALLSLQQEFVRVYGVMDRRTSAGPKALDAHRQQEIPSA